MAEVYQIDVYECGFTGTAAAIQGSTVVARPRRFRVYTIEYMERQALRPRLGLPVQCR